MLEDFVWRGLLAGIGVALVAGPLGCFVVWRRMAYFGDTVAHASLLGVAVAFVAQINPILGIVAVSILVAVLLAAMQQQLQLASDTLLGILSHSALAVGLVVLAMFETVRVDLLPYLFGDMLAVRDIELVYIYAGGAVVLAGLAILWRRLLAITVHEDLARVDGINVPAMRLALTLLVALFIAAAVKVVGILLVTALLIVPAASARRFARSPEVMAVLAAGFGCAAVAGGMALSLTWDSPSGPAVVVAAALLFLLSWLAPKPASR
ncbi:MAG: metal ABC transporter permease [Alphaproteobacteria bacterium]